MFCSCLCNTADRAMNAVCGTDGIFQVVFRQCPDDKVVTYLLCCKVRSYMHLLVHQLLCTVYIVLCRGVDVCSSTDCMPKTAALAEYQRS
jgi:hypothetical protein